jgi:DNA-binding NtrC family response regulator
MRPEGRTEKSILVVDDEENLGVLLERVFRREGYFVATASSSQRALDLLVQRNFAAAIVDIRMYPIDGVTLLGEIRGRSPTTRVIMITGYPTSDSHNECMQKGASAYLVKPFDLETLKSIVRELT